MIKEAHETKKIDSGEVVKKKSLWAEVWYRLKANKLAVFGLILLTIIIVSTTLAGFIYDYETDIITQDIPNKLQAPSGEHWFGTDSFGRDIFARVLYGGRVSLFVGFSVTIISLIFGCSLGAIAGYYGGKTDNIIMRSLDVLGSVPPILLAIAIVSSLGPGIKNLVIAMTISRITAYPRIVRSSVMAVKESEFIEASRAAGSTDPRIILVHVIPNVLAPIIVTVTLSLGGTILGAAGLSFLGLGIMPPQPEWGEILSEGKKYIRYSPYLVLFPGMAIMLTVLSLNFIGDGLRDALDPKLKN